VLRIILDKAAKWTPKLTVKIKVSVIAPSKNKLKAKLKRSYKVLSSDLIK